MSIKITPSSKSIPFDPGASLLTSTSIGEAVIEATSRDKHAGTQLASTISDFNEAAQDAIGLALNNSANISFSYPDEQNLISANLTDTGVTPGNYNLVTVDAKGRITGGAVTQYIGVTSVAVANTTVNYTTVAALTTASLLPGIYRFTFVGLMQSAATNTGVGVRISNVSAAVSTTYAQWAIRQGANGTAASFVYDQLAANTNITSASVAAANTNFTVLGEGVFRVTTAGTVAIQIRSETAGNAATLQPDAVLTVELVQ